MGVDARIGIRGGVDGDMWRCAERVTTRVGGPADGSVKPEHQSMSSESSRRTNRRVTASVPVEYVQTGGAKGSSEIVQLSAGGCVLRATGLDPMGAEVFLHFQLGPKSAEVHLRAHVVHVNPDSGTGLEFISVSPEACELLRQFVAEKVLQSTEGSQRHQ